MDSCNLSPTSSTIEKIHPLQNVSALFYFFFLLFYINSQIAHLVSRKTLPLLAISGVPRHRGRQSHHGQNRKNARGRIFSQIIAGDAAVAGHH
jgi:hypothetical protein